MEATSPVMENLPSEPPGALKKDRRGTLKAAGVIQLILGGFLSLFVVFSILGLVLGRALTPNAAARSAAAPLASAAVYAMGALFFFAVGIGSLRIQRWTRPLVLSFMWPGLLIGLSAFVAGFFLMPPIFDALPLPPSPNPALQRTVLSAVQTGMLVFLFVAGVLIPAFHLLVYQPKSMKETLETYDTKPRFTDTCPAPVFGMTVTLLSIGIMQLFSIGVGFVVFFGLVLTGPFAAFLLVAELVACLAIAHHVFRARLIGWWASLVFLLYLCIRNGVTFLVTDFSKIIAKSGTLDPQTEEAVTAVFSAMPIGAVSAVFWGIAAASAVGYLIYAKKLFH